MTELEEMFSPLSLQDKKIAFPLYVPLNLSCLQLWASWILGPVEKKKKSIKKIIISQGFSVSTFFFYSLDAEVTLLYLEFRDLYFYARAKTTKEWASTLHKIGF